MAWTDLLMLSLACALASASHKSRGSPHGHSLTNSEGLLNETRRVHPYFNPRETERPLITTCCDWESNSSHPTLSRPDTYVSMKCEADILFKFEGAGKDFTSSSEEEEDLGLPGLNRNMTVCLVECLAQHYNMSNDEGQVLFEEAWKDTIANERSELGVTKKIVERCVIRANIVGPAMSRKRNYMCNFASVEFEQCILEQVDMMCPEGSEIKADLCDSYRERLQQKFRVN